MRNPFFRQRARALPFFVTLLLGLAFLGEISPVAAELVTDSAARAGLQSAYGKLPLQFEVNQGQTDPQVKFVSRGSGYGLFLTSTDAVLKANGTALRMRLVGASRASRVEGTEELPGIVNYFIGKDPAKWRTNIPTYRKVRYEGVYPGVDLVYYGNQRELEYDFVVAPGADPRKIALEFKGAGKLRLDSQGDLVVESGESKVRLRKPLTYQEISGVRREVAGRYVLKGRNRVSFQVAAYDATKPLIIDPVLVYSTYLGGTGSEVGQGIAVDPSGNAYVTGFTDSLDFPGVSAGFDATFNGGFYDAFVAKLNPSGSALVYSTYLGGQDFDVANGIGVDASGNACVIGYTFSQDFPTTAGALSRGFGAGDIVAFVTKLNPSGSMLVYSTFLGGGGTAGYGIAVDEIGAAYVTGSAFTGFPTTPGAFNRTFAGSLDVFVAKINPSGSAFVYSGLLGGTGGEYGKGIATDAAGYAYVTGFTYSTDFLTTPGAFQASYGGGLVDGFVAKVNASGSALVYSTYLGGSNLDQPNGIAADGSGNALVTGSTNSADFPTTVGAFSSSNPGTGFSAFVTKLNATGSSLIYSTYLGGALGATEGRGIAVDSGGSAFVIGGTFAADFPTTAGAFSTEFGGAADVVLTEFNPTGSLLYSTYLGGPGSDGGVAIALNAFGNPYLTGATNSTFPTTPGAFSTAYAGGGEDIFITKLNLNNLSNLNNAFVWIGLRNSDDVGAGFDLLAEVFKNGTQIGFGQIDGVKGGSSGFNGAFLNIIRLTHFGPLDLSAGDTLSIRFSVRAGVTGHRSATARLWLNDAAANSGFDTTGGVANAFSLQDGFVLGSGAGPGPKKTIDVFVDRLVGGNPFKPFGTWSKTF